MTMKTMMRKNLILIIPMGGREISVNLKTRESFIIRSTKKKKRQRRRSIFRLRFRFPQAKIQLVMLKQTHNKALNSMDLVLNLR
jgi:hypothetical protein